MKLQPNRWLGLGLASLLLVGGTACANGNASAQDDSSTQGKPESTVDQVSYAIGINVGRNLQGAEVNLDYLRQGVADGLASEGEALMSDQEMQLVMQDFQREMAQRQQQLAQEKAAKNESEGAAFLAENGAKDGVVTLDSGLQYEVLEAGTGANPGPTDRVRVHYRGTLLDGTQFDSSYDRGQPAEFPLTSVIAGWTEGLQLMKEGAKWKLFIPGNLAYGPQGRGNIPPSATLLFEVELLEILE